MLGKDEREIELEMIIPEYNSRNYFVKKLFMDRIKYAIQFARISPNHEILDVGCGNGLLLKKIREQNGEVELNGIDFNRNVNQTKITNCCFVEGDIRETYYKDNSFDTIFALDCLEHIPDTLKAILEIRRILKPYGKFILTGPTETYIYKFCRFLIKGTFSEKAGPCTGVHYYNVNQLDELLQQHGFKKIEEKNLLTLSKVIRYENNKNNKPNKSKSK